MVIVNDLDRLRETLKGMEAPIVMWGFHATFHEGHRKCGEIARKMGGTVVGCLWQNFAEGTRYLMGNTTDADRPLDPNDVAALKRFSDVVLIIEGSYTFDELLSTRERIEREIPLDGLPGHFRDDGRAINSLRYSMALRIVMHEYHGVKIDYCVGSVKDDWRHPYAPWCEKSFGFKMVAIPPALDENGNTVSGCFNRMQPKMQERIDRTLVHPHFTSVEQVREHIKDIEGLVANDFWQADGYVGCTFTLGGISWAIGVKR